ncbi:MAG: hypothetical protein ACK5WP_09545 [Neisseriaceae bacterium]|jgi:hypothetical protein
MGKKDFSDYSNSAAEEFLSLTRDAFEDKSNTKKLDVPINNYDNLEKIVAKSFSFQKKDLDNVLKMTDKFLDLKKRVTQSEVIRIGISLVMRLNDKELLEELDGLERINVGRKPKSQN